MLKKLKSVVAIVMATLLIVGHIPHVVAHEEVSHLEVPVETEQRQLSHRGLIGFDGYYDLTDSHTLVDVIVVFEQSPAGIQVMEAMEAGTALSYNQAMQRAEDAHTLFRSELSALFGNQSVARAGSNYTFNAEFRRGLNGVAMSLPANMVSDVAHFRSVQAIFPDESVYLPELPIAELSIGDPFGMSQGRSRMNAHELHQRGIRGEGVVIAVIDSGIDWHHPAFTGTFPTIAEMQLRNPSLTNAHGININGTYYFVGRDFIRLWPNGNGADVRGNPTTLPSGEPGNNPMEFSPVYFPNRHAVVDNAGNTPNWTSHGTHVAGTIVGQPVPVSIDINSGEEVWDMQHAILGVAPDAKVFHYRALFGSTPVSVILSSLEFTYYDRPDVVNLSLGGGLSTPLAVQNLAINNLALQNPNKVFVISSGNAGPNFYTGGNPGGATMALTVSALTEQSTLMRAEVISNNVTGTAFTVMDNPNGEWVVRPNGSLINTFPRLIDNDGEYRIFALPHCGAVGATGTEDIDVGAAAGPMLVDAFVDLFLYYGPDALNGAFVLIKRPMDNNFAIENASLIAFNPGMIGAPPGIFDVLGGVIIIDGTAPNRTNPSNFANLDILVPTLMIDNANGRSLLENIRSSNTGYATFSLRGDIVSQTVASISSRGPVWESFEIKPDVGAHGMDVFSAVPRWTFGGAAANNPNWENIPWTHAYDFRSGTSMSTPHVAGGVALMIQYSQMNGNRWDNQEIKSRIMNTAIAINYLGNNYGVFDGARQIDVWAAVQGDTVVSVSYPRVATLLGTPFTSQPFETAGTGSFSFGGFNRYGNNAMSESLTATIINQSSESRTYTIHHEFITTGRNSLSGATLSHPSSITVGGHSSANFTATLTIPPGDATGHYEGYVIVSLDGTIVARLPFAGVAIYMPPTIQDVATYRAVISTGAYAYNKTSSELVISFTPNFGFSSNLHLVRAVDGITSYNWMRDEFSHAVLGTVGESRFLSNAFIQPGTPLRGIVFDGIYTPVNCIEPVLLIEEGDFYIVMEVWRQSPNLTNSWAWQEDIFIPFSVDNTPPQLNNLLVNNTVADLAENTVIISPEPSGIIISGNATDAWLSQAIINNTTFDVWNTTNPFGPAVSIPSNIAMFALLGEATQENSPIPVSLDTEGNFTVTFANSDQEDTLTIWLIDGYAPVPVANQNLFGSSAWNTPGVARIIPDTENTLRVADDISAFARHDGIFGVAIESNHYHWAGLNVAEMSIAIHYDTETQDRFYDVTFKANGGVILPASMSYFQPEFTTPSALTPTITDAILSYTITVHAGETVGENLPSAGHDIHTFHGWNSSQDGVGFMFDANTPISGHTVLYAMWEKISLPLLPSVVRVEVSPLTTTIIQGREQQFNAIVTVENNANTGVIWSVSGHGGASISPYGVLSVTSSVPINTVLTVRAVSEFNASIYGTASVTVVAQQPEPPTAPPAETPPVQRPTPPRPSEPNVSHEQAQQSPTQLPLVPREPTPVESPTEVVYYEENITEEYAEELIQYEPVVLPDLLLPLPSPASPTLASQSFYDISANDWFYNYIGIAVGGGLFQGLSEGIFAPNISMTRAMFVQLLANFENADLESIVFTTQSFADVDTGAWYFAAVEWATGQGLVQGVGHGEFAPNSPITREQMAALLYRFIQLSNISLDTEQTTPFVDQSAISQWAVEAVEVIQSMGIIQGRSDGRFDPHATATRAEVAALFVRFINRIN